MKDWKTDKSWSDKFIPAIKLIVAPHVIGEADVEEDQERNTDLLVLRAETKRIGRPAN